jgi:hypothetical protein
MAVAYETSIAPWTETFLAAGGSVTEAINAGTGSNRVLTVAVFWRDRNNTISGITYNGVAMTSLGTQVTEGTLRGQLWRLAGPASGSNTLEITYSAGDSNSPVWAGAHVCNGVDQTTPTSGYVSNQGQGSTANIVSSATVTSATDDMVVTYHATFNQTENITATPTNYTERQDAADGGGYSLEFGDAAGAASVATSATWSNGAYLVYWIAFGVSVEATSGGGGLQWLPQCEAGLRSRTRLILVD